MEKLVKIQNELKVEKGRKNEYQGFKYRSFEDITKNLKPLLEKYNCSLYFSDTLEVVGTGIYLKTIATLVDNETKEHIDVTAYAREDENKATMSNAQMTGSCSSYARKYALNGLFLLDDTKDIDSIDTRTPSQSDWSVLQKLAGGREQLVQMLKARGIDANKITFQEFEKLKSDLNNMNSLKKQINAI